MGDMRSDDVDQKVIDRYGRKCSKETDDETTGMEGIAVAVWVYSL